MASRALKRSRQGEMFWGDSEGEKSGIFLKVTLKSGNRIKSKGWPWVQASIRGILGGQDRVEKASFLSDDSLLLKSKNEKQTDRLLKATYFGDEECSVVKADKLNESKGTIYAHDLIDLSEEEVVWWLKEYGVVGVRRITKRVGPRTLNTPLLILTFDRPECPTHLNFDYISYEVRCYIPNPLICLQCGQYGHVAVKCKAQAVCLKCGQGKHEGECATKCIHCSSESHTCLSRVCTKWQKEKAICEIKVKEDISYAQARRVYESRHKRPTVPSYAAAISAPPPTAATPHEVQLQERVNTLEKKVDEMLNLLTKLVGEKGKTQNDPPADQHDLPQREDAAGTNMASADGKDSEVSVHEMDSENNVDKNVSQEVGGRRDSRGSLRGREGGRGNGRGNVPSTGPSISDAHERKTGLGTNKQMPSLTRMTPPGEHT